MRPKQQRPWANYKDKGWRKTPFAAEKRIERSLTANNGQRARHVRDMVWQNFGKVIHRRTAARELQRQGWVDKVTTTSSDLPIHPVRIALNHTQRRAAVQFSLARPGACYRRFTDFVGHPLRPATPPPPS